MDLSDMISFFDILKLQNIDPSDVMLVRHGNKEMDILDAFVNDNLRFEVYQSFQKYNRFGKAKHIAVFSPSRGTTALLLGLWDIKRHIKNEEFPKRLHNLISKHSFPEKWHRTSGSWYDLKRNTALDEYSQRIVIEWGKSTVSWCQAKDKPILEIKAPNSIGDFVSYDDIQLGYADIRKLAKDSDSNVTWVNALSAVNGIYLITDTTTGKLYVGSAYGDKGIWGRWCSYARTGHGGNKELKPLNPASFEFSILEIITANSSAEDVITRENRWKNRLGTRTSGLNQN